MFTMAPGFFSRTKYAAKAWDIKNVPVRPTSSVLRQSASESSIRGFASILIAPFTRKSTPPKADSAASTACLQSDGRLTSNSMNAAFASPNLEDSFFPR